MTDPTEDEPYIHTSYPPPRRETDGSARMLGILLIAAAGFWIGVGAALVLILGR